MKSLVFLILCFFCLNLASQSFHRGSVVFDLNSGIEGYKTTQKYSGANELADTAVKSQAANAHVVLGVEVGLNRWLGVGVKGKANSFFRDLDNVTRQHTDMSSTDLLVSLNIHPVSRKKFDLLVGVDLGFSDLRFDFEDIDDLSWSSNGVYAAPYINPRFYFGRFGVNLRTNLPYLNYNDFESSGETNAGNYMLEAWKGSGFGVSLGIQLRLF